MNRNHNTEAAMPSKVADGGDKPRSSASDKKPDLARKRKATEQLSIQDSAEDRDIHEDFMMGHCVKLRHKLWFKSFVFMVVMALDAADLIADWLLFHDVYMVKEGLVYGPPEKAIIYALLVFSVIGTLTFLFEVINLWWEIFRENPWINADLMSAVTIWVEDMPQIVLNVMIAVCREDAISYFQLVKASVIIFSIVIRIIVCLIRYCNKSSLSELHDKSRTSRLHVAYRFIIVIGLLLVFGCSLSVFFLTQFERTKDGGIKFHTPKTAFEGKYDEERYFQNVSMYFFHPIIDFDNVGKGTEDVNWLRLISLYDVREKEKEVFKLEFDDATKTKLVIYQTDTSGSLGITDCYTIDKATKSVVQEANCANLITGAKSAFIFNFEFIKKSIPSLIFGDVKFKSEVKEAGGVCHGPSTSIKTRLNEITDGLNQDHAVIHYYRTNNVSQEKHLIVTAGTNTARFYRNKEDLIDITEVWQTGYGYCDTTGSMAPHLDKDMNVNCNV